MNNVMDKVLYFVADIFCKLDIWFIVGSFMINCIVFWVTLSEIKKVKDMLNPTSDKKNGVSASMKWNATQISALEKMREKMVIYYAWYANITAIFPLLGILGTVAALVTYSDITMMDNFMVALNTTLLGIFFAILFKAIDAKLSGPLDVTIEDADCVIQEFNREKRLKDEA